jgi:hypothetical protein
MKTKSEQQNFKSNYRYYPEKKKHKDLPVP